jgi:hypothetical protein
MANTKTAFTAASLAEEFGTTGRELRKFLRTAESGIAPVGKGGRYSLELTPTAVKSLRKKFSAWNDAADAAKIKRAEDNAAKALNVLTVTPASEGVDEVDENDDETEIDFENATDEELEDWTDDALIANALAEIDAEGTDEA